jgi:hypothetical protein
MFTGAASTSEELELLAPGFVALDVSTITSNFSPHVRLARLALACPNFAFKWAISGSDKVLGGGGGGGGGGGLGGGGNIGGFGVRGGIRVVADDLENAGEMKG